METAKSQQPSLPFEHNQHLQQHSSSIITQLKIIIQQISKRIHDSQIEWKNMYYASLEDEGQQLDDIQQKYSDWLQKYRGSKGQVKSIGLILYFQFLKFVIILFIFLTIVSLPTLISNYSGNGLQSLHHSQYIPSFFIRISLANQNYYKNNTASHSQITIIKHNKNIVVINDIVCIFILMLGLFWWKIKSNYILTQYIAKSPLPNLYALEITNIPHNINTIKLEKHFQYFGKVCQIEPIKDYQNNLIIMKSIVRLIYRYNRFSHKRVKQKKIFNQICNLYLYLSELYLQKPMPTIQSAFVTFDSIYDRNYTYELYKYSIKPKKLMINQKLPVVKKCYIDPLTINWENYHLKTYYHTKKNIFQCIFLIIMVFAIVIALFLVNINSNQIKMHLKQHQFQNIPSYYSLNDASSIEIFCSNLKLQKLLDYPICSKQIDNIKKQFGLMILFSVLVFVINMLTNLILRQLVEFRRYKTIAEKNNFLISAIFLFSLINSGILIVVMRSKHLGPILHWIICKIFYFQYSPLQIQLFGQFNRKWYMEIGNQLIFNYIITLIICPHLYIFQHAFRLYFCKRFTNHPYFNYCTFYALSLKALFFALFYSQSMPILYFLAVISTMIQYVVAKILLRLFVREPMFFEPSSNEAVLRILPYALIIHTFLSIMFFNVNDIFYNGVLHENASWIANILNKFKQGYIHSIVLLILILFSFVSPHLYKILLSFYKPLKPLYSQTFTHLAKNPSILSSFRMKDNPRYKIIAYAMELFESHMKRIPKDDEPITEMQLINHNIHYNVQIVRQSPLQNAVNANFQ